MKDPVKLACKELPRYGARLMWRDSRCAVFTLPNGSTWQVNRRTLIPTVRDVINDAYLTAVGLRGFSNVANPGIRPERLRSSDHFMHRLDLMHGQAGVTMREVLEALATPVKVLANSDRSKLAVVGPRVTPIVARDEINDLVLVTLYWSRADLFARYPRPEKEVCDE